MLASKSSDVRCRLIGEADLGEVAACLTRGFPERSNAYWREALARMAGREAIEDYPRFGYLMEASGRVVGVLLLIHSRRAVAQRNEIRCNLSSWCVDPPYRGYALALHANGVRRKEVTYTNLTAAPHTRPGLEAMGFRRFSDGLFIFAPILSRSRGATRIVAYADDAPEASLLQPGERTILAEHAAFGCRALIGVNGRHALGLVLQSRPLRHRRLACERLLYCRDAREIPAFAGALGRYLLRRGIFLCLIDASGPLPGLVGRFLANREPKYFKGVDAPRLGDLAYSEFALLGL